MIQDSKLRSGQKAELQLKIFKPGSYRETDAFKTAESLGEYGKKNNSQVQEGREQAE